VIGAYSVSVLGGAPEGPEVPSKTSRSVTSEEVATFRTVSTRERLAQGARRSIFGALARSAVVCTGSNFVETAAESCIQVNMARRSATQTRATHAVAVPVLGEALEWRFFRAPIASGRRVMDAARWLFGALARSAAVCTNSYFIQTIGGRCGDSAGSP
jgi:hypothetical protein